MDLTYFTCTLGEAVLHKKTDHSFTNISDFIDKQGQDIPSRPAVGFYSTSPDVDGPWQPRILTFSDIREGCRTVANILSRASKQGLSSSNTVALLCSSTAEFMFIWLALMRLGHSVLLVAPQCQSPAIADLCMQTGVSCLLFDDQYLDVARHTGSIMSEDKDSDFWIFDIQSVMGAEGVFQTIQEEAVGDVEACAARPWDLAFLFHTSGTSTGMPKPIPLSHFAAVGVLPRLDGSEAATFTTTPLYHGGIADLFRSWSSNTMTWLFPGKGVPITAANIVRCLDAAEKRASDETAPRIKYFSSVPYVLQMMEQDPRGMQYLQKMDIVGVGGAALPDEVGNRLVNAGVNLVSRFGSAECGFLLSSHREYKKDKDWQFLRDYTSTEARQQLTEKANGQTINGDTPSSQSMLCFEARDEGLSELIVLSAWPHRVKTNRTDDSYATSDLFEQHATVQNAWRYHSRADSQLTLITGKKFDPTPVENTIAASSPLLSDVVVFGNGEPFPGALLFRSEAAEEVGDEGLVDKVWPAVEKFNQHSQAHSRLSRSMLVAMPYDGAKLQKSSKGTLMRGKVMKRFEGVVEHAYSRAQDKIDPGKVEDEDLVKYLLDQVNAIQGNFGGNTGKQLSEDTDLFAYGLDSVASIQLRNCVSRLVGGNGDGLPFSIVEDCGTVKRLGDFVRRKRHGHETRLEVDEEQLMLELVEKYSSFQPQVEVLHRSLSDKEVVVLTGATGALGAHVLHQFRRSEHTSKIYCLVRGADAHAARERVNKALSQKGLPALDSPEQARCKIEILQCQLSKPLLGLDRKTYSRIASEATVIIHLAWAVNFRLKLRSFEREHIAGTNHLINLALSCPAPRPPTFIFCSSTASCTGRSDPVDSTSATHGSPVTETVTHAPTSASALGYGRSKWVAEQCVSRASAASSSLRGRLAILRVGQLSGDTERGVWNTQEAWPLMLRSMKVTGALPALRDQVLGWLPVDVAAQAILETAEAMRRSEVAESGTVKVYHILNENITPTWMDMLEWLRKSKDFESLDPREWLKRLEKSAVEHPEHPALKLLGLWKDAYGQTELAEYQKWRFDMKETKAVIPVMRQTHSVDEAYFSKLWSWLEDQDL